MVMLKHRIEGNANVSGGDQPILIRLPTRKSSIDPVRSLLRAGIAEMNDSDRAVYAFRYLRAQLSWILQAKMYNQTERNWYLAAEKGQPRTRMPFYRGIAQGESMGVGVGLCRLWRSYRIDCGCEAARD